MSLVRVPGQYFEDHNASPRRATREVEDDRAMLPVLTGILVGCFSQAARESADSRVYAGIHFRSACEDGLALGRKVGERADAIYLQPVRR
jgi:hypothetical protein